MTRYSIAILSTCSSDVGLGHLMRCYKLATFLVDHPDYDVSLHIAGELPKDYKLELISVSSISPSLKNSIAQLLERDIDVIILDVHDLYIDRNFKKLLKQIKKSKVKIISIDNLHIFQRYIDVLYYPSFSVSEEIIKLCAQKAKFGWDCYFLKPSRREIRKSSKHVLLTAGGTDLENIGPRILTNLTISDWPDTYFTYIQGPYSTPVKKENYSRLNLRIVKSPAGIENFILKTDIGVTLYGVTFFEMIFNETVTILYIPKNSKDYSISLDLKNLKICSVVNEIEDITLEISKLRISKEIRNLYQKNIRNLKLKSGFETFQNELSLILQG